MVMPQICKSDVQPDMDICHQRRVEFLADCKAISGVPAVGGVFDIEQGIKPLGRFERNRIERTGQPRPQWCNNRRLPTRWEPVRFALRLPQTFAQTATAAGSTLAAQR